jgi:hypothetical protein
VLLNRLQDRVRRDWIIGPYARARGIFWCGVLGLIICGGCGGGAPNGTDGIWGPTVVVQNRKRPLIQHQQIRGELETVFEHRSDEQKAGTTQRKSTSDTFKERARVGTRGDVYHPDLLSYNVTVGAGLAQEHLDSDDLSGWSTGTLSEYNASAEILRSKPYSATLNANKSQDLIARQFLGPLQADTTSESASVFLRPESWPMSFQYSRSDTRQDGFSGFTPDFFSRQDERYRYSVSHEFSKLSHLHFDFDRSEAHQESVGAEIDTTTNDFTLSHDYTFGSKELHRLDSLFNYLDQGGTFAFQNLRWQERLRLQHTPSLLSRYDLQYNVLDRETLNSEQIRGQAGIEHRLFESLVSTLDGFTSRTDLGPDGDLLQYGGILGLSYRKLNPLGTLLGGYNASYTRSDQTGGLTEGVVVGEPHTATDLVPIELDRTNIDITTIRVRTAGGSFFQLGDDYTIFQSNGRVFLTTFVVGGVVPPNFTVGEEFFVDYEYFIEPERQEDTFRQSFTIRERFSNGFSVFYGYRMQQQDITSTVTQIIPDEYTVNTVGADYTKQGLFLRAEYSQEDSTLIPMESTKVEGRYRWAIGAATSASLGAANHWLSFGAPDARDVRLFEATAELFSRLTDAYSVSASGNYRNEEDTRFGATRGFQFRTELGYQFRQFSANVGGELDLLKRRSDEINSLFLYIRALRRF